MEKLLEDYNSFEGAEIHKMLRFPEEFFSEELNLYLIYAKMLIKFYSPNTVTFHQLQ